MLHWPPTSLNFAHKFLKYHKIFLFFFFFHLIPEGCWGHLISQMPQNRKANESEARRVTHITYTKPASIAVVTGSKNFVPLNPQISFQKRSIYCTPSKESIISLINPDEDV